MIPPSHRAEEFSLTLRWTPKVNGVTPPVPGFYLHSYFANEGAASGVVKNSWDGGRGLNGALVGRDFLGTLFKLLAEEDLLVPQQDERLASQLADRAESAQSAAIAAKRAHLERLRQEVAELESVLDNSDESL